MGWETSNRRASLPREWHKLRAQAKKRAGGQCERITAGTRCRRQGTDLHHAGGRGSHNLGDLEWLCRTHHDAETQKQAKAAQHAKWVDAKRRTPERHPGAPADALPWLR
ncbi:hypothetical protein GCM10011490_24120 [Pseudoclavibacter endophyticus]|nr:hypothetical protein GCM10011490_24120 [Pseudoclavibacter endophyticus]